MGKLVRNPWVWVTALAVIVGGWWWLSREETYEVPGSLCDMVVDPQITEALLPPGEKLEVAESSTGGSGISAACRVDVDGKSALHVEIYHFETSFQDLRDWHEVVSGSFGFAAVEEDRIEGDNILLASNGSLMRAECPNGTDTVLDINVRGYAISPGQESAEGRQHMKDFTAAVMASAKEQYGC
ncbi:hypothetical protein [Streptomyces carpaticus]|uniref:DUF3558 domain-containing protein n=1 Tax=Streptomyces carpaticus TaxID=285558 RepID=A0ABV4ZRU6_9ACTN